MARASILFTRSTDCGASFSTPIPVSNDIPGSSFLFLNAIDANGDNVYVVWTRVTDVSSIYVAKSSNGGVTFSNPVQVESGGNARAPVIAVSGTNVYVAWQDFSTSPMGLESEIFFAASIDGGNTFSTPVNVSDNPPTFSRTPSIAASGNNVFVVWSDCNTSGLNCRTLYAKSNDAGLTLTAPVAISDPESFLPDISVLGNTVYVVYSQYSQNPQLREVFLIKGTDAVNGGTIFGDSVNLSDSPTFNQNPRIDVSGNNVAIQWEHRDPSDPDPHWEVVFVGSTDGGVTFGSQTSVTGNSFPTSNANLNDIAISGEHSVFYLDYSSRRF